MGQLVQNSDHPALSNSVGDLRAEHVTFGESHSTGVLHRSGVELWHKELVIFFKRVGHLEFVFKVGETFFGDIEDVLRVEIFKQRGSGKNAEWNGFAARTN